MYPLRVDKPFLKKQWYVAATCEEVTQKVLARTICDVPLVFFRTQEGKPAALYGLCPHRLMPLAFASLKNDQLICAYHGITFDASGKCVKVPTAEKIPSRCALKSYAVVERGPWIWVWMDEAETADVSLLPDASDIGLGDDATGWRIDITKYFPLQARAQLLIDNLFDLSHLAFVHATSVQSDATSVALLSPRISDDANGVVVMREIADISADPGTLAKILLPEIQGQVYFELFTRMYNVCLINSSGPWIYDSLQGGKRGKPLGKLNFVHAVTPETRNSTHYFGVLTRDFRHEDDELSQFLVAQNDRVRAEDLTILEAIEKVADRYGDFAKEVSIAVDTGALKVRKIITSQLQLEEAQASHRPSEKEV